MAGSHEATVGAILITMAISIYLSQILRIIFFIAMMVTAIIGSILSFWVLSPIVQRLAPKLKSKPLFRVPAKGGMWQVRELSGQTGYLSQNSLNAEFGLGDAAMIDSIHIEWPQWYCAGHHSCCSQSAFIHNRKNIIRFYPDQFYY